MPHTIDIVIPLKRRRSDIGKFLTTLKGLRHTARKPVPARPRVQEHDQAIPDMRTPNQYRGAYIERYEPTHGDCACDECAAKRTGDGYDGSDFVPVYQQTMPGRTPFEQVFRNALGFFEVSELPEEAWVAPATDAFEESAHPRGDTENAGRFTKAGGGNAKEVAETAGGAKASKSAALVAAKPDRSDFPEHIKKLGVPPAWTNVHYNPDPQADLLVQGRDAKNRLQPIYSAKYQQDNALAKFGRVRKLEDLIGNVVRQNETNRSSHIPIVRDTADVTKLIMETGIRPGSDGDTKASIKAYGATTLLGQHVKADVSGVSLDYMGKDAVHLQIPIPDKDTADMVRARAKKAGSDGKLFPNTNAKRLRGYVKQLSGSDEVKTKDFRTYVANTVATQAVQDLPAPTTEVAYKRQVREVAIRVSQKLGNTPTIALASYINPVVFAEWRAGLTG